MKGSLERAFCNVWAPICPLALPRHQMTTCYQCHAPKKRQKHTLAVSLGWIKHAYIFFIPLMMSCMGGAGPKASATMFLERLAAMLHDREAPLQLQQCPEAFASDCHQMYTDMTFVLPTMCKTNQSRCCRLQNARGTYYVGLTDFIFSKVPNLRCSAN